MNIDFNRSKYFIVLFLVLVVALAFWYFFLAKQYKTYYFTSDQGDEAVVVLYKTKLDKFYNHANLRFQGKDYKLKKVISASGAKFANEDESMIYWNKSSQNSIFIGEKHYRLIAQE